MSVGPPVDRAPADGAPPPIGEILRVWLSLGAQSFGGGVATLYLIRRAVVEHRGWLTEQEFTRYWAICQVAPGINLLGLTILIGWKLARVPGILVATAGLLLPSGVIAVLATALFARYHTLGPTHAALKGIVPATLALGLVTSYQMARPLLAAGRQEGRGSLLVGVAILVGSAVLVPHLSVLSILALCGALGGLWQWWRARGKPETE